MSKDMIIQALRENLFEEPDRNIYAVLDGASIPNLLSALYEHEPEYCCLYRGKLEPGMAEVAPYLVRLDPEAPITEWILDNGWGKHWGIFATTDADFKALRKHFRTFLMVRSPKGQSIYFRYYDPRVFGVYLPTCNAEEMEIVFGPVEKYEFEGDPPDLLLRFKPHKESVQVEKISLAKG